MIELSEFGLFERTHFRFASTPCSTRVKKDKNLFLGIHFHTSFKIRVYYCDSIPFKMLDLVLHLISHVVHLLLTAFTDQQMRHERNYPNSHLVSQTNLKPGVFFTFSF